MASQVEIAWESPQYLRTSLAAAMTLGLKPGRFFRDAKPRCLNLLLTYSDGCRARCSYCGLAKQRRICGEQTFIRVSWPTYSLRTIMKQLEQYSHPFERVCISMVTHPRAHQDALELITEFHRRTDLLISVLVAPTALPDLKANLQSFRAAGAEMCGIALDAATPELFAAHRGSGVAGPHSWDRYWQSVSAAVEVFGRFKVGVHLIVGLGETEAEMVQTIAKAHNLGAYTHLFSFFPEPGSELAGYAQPPIGQYRRVQLARYLINECGHDAKRIRYDSVGKIIDFGCEVEPVIAAGEAFMTSGCHGTTCRYACNRPFGNERPSEPLRNYPFQPDERDLILIREQLQS